MCAERFLGERATIAYQGSETDHEISYDTILCEQKFVGSVRNLIVYRSKFSIDLALITLGRQFCGLGGTCGFFPGKSNRRDGVVIVHRPSERDE